MQNRCPDQGLDEPLFCRTPYLEVQVCFEDLPPPALPEDLDPVLKDRAIKGGIAIGNSIQHTIGMASPKVVKSHLPFEVLPPSLLDTCKVVYVCRNPRDACASYFHHFNIWAMSFKMKAGFESFEELYMEGELSWGFYWSHLKSAWSRRAHPNLKIIWYEDLKRDLAGVISDLDGFLGTGLTQAQMAKVQDRVSFGAMKERIPRGMGDPGITEIMSRFFRKGVVGGYKEFISDDRFQDWEEWIKNNLKETDITMPKPKQ